MSSKPAAPKQHPAYSQMVLKAITDLKERNGSSRQAIVKYIQSNYQGIGDHCSKKVTKTIKSQIAAGKVKEGKGGPFKFALTDVAKAKPAAPKKKPAVKKVSKPKKPAPAKKAVTKKPSGKKPAVKKASANKKPAKKAGTPKKGAKTPTKKSKAKGKSPAKKAGKKPTPKKTGKKPAQKK